MARISSVFLLLCLLAPQFLVAQSSRNREEECPPTMYEIWGIGKRYYDLGDYRSAIEAFKDVIFLDPTYIEAYEYKGHALFWLRDYEGSLLDFNESIRYYEDQMQNAPKQGQDVPHDLLLITHTEYDDKLEQLYNNRGTSYYQIGDYASAYLDFQRALTFNPTSQESRHNLDIAKKTLKARGIPIPGTKPQDNLFERVFSSKKSYENVQGSSTCQYFVVNKVELTRSATLLYFQVVNPPEEDQPYFINVKPNTKDAFYLLGKQETKYKLKKAYDQLTEKVETNFTIQPGTQQSIVLEFERIPDEFRSVHLIDGNIDPMSSCSIYDIQLQ